MPLSKSDHSLSMLISRKPRKESPEKTAALRTLLVHRLRGTAKAVARLPLSWNVARADHAAAYKVHCEPCARWFTLPEWGEEVQCPRCSRLYALEFAVFSELPEASHAPRGAETG